MMRVEIGIKMDRLAEILVRSPNRLEDIRDLCLEVATDIDQYLQEVEDAEYEDYPEDDEEEEETYENNNDDERYSDYHYRYGDEEENY
jgi:RimJ/RimL family protein N-acetyltransferase